MSMFHMLNTTAYWGPPLAAGEGWGQCQGGQDWHTLHRHGWSSPHCPPTHWNRPERGNKILLYLEWGATDWIMNRWEDTAQVLVISLRQVSMLSLCRHSFISWGSRSDHNIVLAHHHLLHAATFGKYHTESSGHDHRRLHKGSALGSFHYLHCLGWTTASFPPLNIS